MEHFIKAIVGINFRLLPDANSLSTRVLPKGTIAEVIKEDEETNTTYYQVVLEDGSTGYVTSKPQYVIDYIPEWERLEMNIAADGESFLGANYVFGAKRYTIGQAPSVPVFDCSSFQRYIFGLNGISLGYDSRQQSIQGTSASLDDLRSGDLVFYSDDGYVYHVVQYINVNGFDRILHTFDKTNTNIVRDRYLEPTGQIGGVTYSDFSVGTYWRNHADFARRVNNL